MYGQNPIYGETLVGEGEDHGNFLGFYKYDNAHEFIEVIKYFRKIILDYGFRALDNISLPTTEIRPTKETNLYLYENHKELNEKYREKLGINDNISHEEIFKIAQECLIKTQGEAFDTVKDTLIGLAAVVGTVYVDISNGGWLWNPDKHICWVTNKAKYPKMDYPLSTIIVCWRENPEHTFTILNNGFLYFKT